MEGQRGLLFICCFKSSLLPVILLRCNPFISLQKCPTKKARLSVHQCDHLEDTLHLFEFPMVIFLVIGYSHWEADFEEKTTYWHAKLYLHQYLEKKRGKHREQKTKAVMRIW